MMHAFRVAILVLVFALATVQAGPRKVKHHEIPRGHIAPAKPAPAKKVADTYTAPQVRRADVYMCGSDTEIDHLESGNILSPGYPAFYPNNQDCSVTVDQPAGVTGQILSVTANAFWTERNFDFLYIYYGDNGEFQRFTGNSASSTDNNAMEIGVTYTFASTTGALRFRFTSDVSVIEPGFNITYSVTADTTTDPPATDSPTAGDRCSDVSGEYQSESGDVQMIIEQDKEPTDTDFEVVGIYRNNSNPLPIWLQFLGHSGAGESQSYGISVTVYGETNLVTLSGLCEECTNGKQLDLYETVVQEDSPDCVGNPTVSMPKFVRLFEVPESRKKTSKVLTKRRR